MALLVYLDGQRLVQIVFRSIEKVQLVDFGYMGNAALRAGKLEPLRSRGIWCFGVSLRAGLYSPPKPGGNLK
jgi:hypothetical protein